MHTRGQDGTEGLGCRGFGRGRSCRCDRAGFGEVFGGIHGAPGASFGGHGRDFPGGPGNFGRGLNRQPYESGDHSRGFGRRCSRDHGVFHRGFGVGACGFGGHHHHGLGRHGGHPHSFGGHAHGICGHPYRFEGHSHGFGGHSHGFGGHSHGFGNHSHGFGGLRGHPHGVGGHRGGFRGNFWGNRHVFGEEAPFCNHEESDED